MPLSFAELEKEITDYVAAHPNQWHDIVILAYKVGSPDPRRHEPELVYQDVTTWYEKIAALGTRGNDGRYLERSAVVPYDDTTNKRIGYLVEADGLETTSFVISAQDCRAQREKINPEVRKLMKTPLGRAKLASMFMTGTAPPISHT